MTSEQQSSLPGCTTLIKNNARVTITENISLQNFIARYSASSTTPKPLFSGSNFGDSDRCIPLNPYIGKIIKSKVNNKLAFVDTNGYVRPIPSDSVLGSLLGKNGCPTTTQIVDVDDFSKLGVYDPPLVIPNDDWGFEMTSSDSCRDVLKEKMDVGSRLPALFELALEDSAIGYQSINPNLRPSGGSTTSFCPTDILVGKCRKSSSTQKGFLRLARKGVTRIPATCGNVTSSPQTSSSTTSSDPINPYLCRVIQEVNSSGVKYFVSNTGVCYKLPTTERYNEFLNSPGLGSKTVATLSTTLANHTTKYNPPLVNGGDIRDWTTAEMILNGYQTVPNVKNNQNTLANPYLRSFLNTKGWGWVIDSAGNAYKSPNGDVTRYIHSSCSSIGSETRHNPDNYSSPNAAQAAMKYAPPLVESSTLLSTSTNCSQIQKGAKIDNPYDRTIIKQAIVGSSTSTMYYLNWNADKTKIVARLIENDTILRRLGLDYSKIITVRFSFDDLGSNYNQPFEVSQEKMREFHFCEAIANTPPPNPYIRTVVKFKNDIKFYVTNKGELRKIPNYETRVTLSGCPTNDIDLLAFDPFEGLGKMNPAFKFGPDMVMYDTCADEIDGTVSSTDPACVLQTQLKMVPDSALASRTILSSELYNMVTYIASSAINFLAKTYRSTWADASDRRAANSRYAYLMSKYDAFKRFYNMGYILAVPDPVAKVILNFLNVKQIDLRNTVDFATFNVTSGSDGYNFMKRLYRESDTVTLLFDFLNKRCFIDPDAHSGNKVCFDLTKPAPSMVFVAVGGNSFIHWGLTSDKRLQQIGVVFDAGTKSREIQKFEYTPEGYIKVFGEDLYLTPILPTNGSNPAPGARITAQPLLSGTQREYQKWTLINWEVKTSLDGRNRFIHNATGLSMDVAGSSTNSDVDIQLQNYANSSNQKFYINKVEMELPSSYCNDFIFNSGGDLRNDATTSEIFFDSLSGLQLRGTKQQWSVMSKIRRLAENYTRTVGVTTPFSATDAWRYMASYDHLLDTWLRERENLRVRVNVELKDKTEPWAVKSREYVQYALNLFENVQTYAQVHWNLYGNVLGYTITFDLGKYRAFWKNAPALSIAGDVANVLASRNSMTLANYAGQVSSWSDLDLAKHFCENSMFFSPVERANFRTLEVTNKLSAPVNGMCNVSLESVPITPSSSDSLAIGNSPNVSFDACTSDVIRDSSSSMSDEEAKSYLTSFPDVEALYVANAATSVNLTSAKQHWRSRLFSVTMGSNTVADLVDRRFNKLNMFKSGSFSPPNLKNIKDLLSATNKTTYTEYVNIRTAIRLRLKSIYNWLVWVSEEVDKIYKENKLGDEKQYKYSMDLIQKALFVTAGVSGDYYSTGLEGLKTIMRTRPTAPVPPPIEGNGLILNRIFLSGQWYYFSVDTLGAFAYLDTRTSKMIYDSAVSSKCDVSQGLNFTLDADGKFVFSSTCSGKTIYGVFTFIMYLSILTINERSRLSSDCGACTRVYTRQSPLYRTCKVMKQKGLCKPKVFYDVKSVSFIDGIDGTYVDDSGDPYIVYDE